MAKRTTSQFADTPAFAELQAHLAKPKGDRDAMWEYRLGSLVEAVCPKRESKYGQGNIQALSADLGGSQVLTNKLWNARNLVDEIPEKEITALLKLAKTNSFKLTASHVLTLATVQSKVTRKAIGKKCVKRQLGIKQLRREIYRLQDKKIGGGALPTKPKTADEALGDLLERTRTWLNYYEKAWFAVEGVSLTRPLTKSASMRLSGDLKEAIILLGKVEQVAGAGKRRLRELRSGAKR